MCSPPPPFSLPRWCVLSGIAFLFLAALAGCRNWVEVNEPISFVPTVLRSLADLPAPQRSLRLTDGQASELVGSLRGAVRRAFTQADLDPTIEVSWWYGSRGTVAFVRFARDRKSHVWIAYDSSGRLFGQGSGNAPAQPPW
jgi:hypothetical protein